MIEVSHLTKKYGQKKAVDNISFNIEEGEIVGFLGPNGAGKSTTMNILTGYISASGGTAKIGGIDILENPIEAKKKIGYLPEQPPLYFDMTVEEQLSFVSDLKKIDKAKKAQEISQVCEMVRISDVKKRLIRNLSKGYKQRVGLAQALLGSPEVLILDEPTVGLDPKQIIEIRNVIKNLGKQHTIILSSHILSEVSAICERVLVINKGKIVANDTPDQLSSTISGERKLMARIAGPQVEVTKTLKGILGVSYCEASGSSENGSVDYIIEADQNVDIRKPLFYALAGKSYPILMLKPLDISLEDIFLQLTGDQAQKEEQ
jgi:ABC-2 type transport system ATP-binding protein